MLMAQFQIFSVNLNRTTYPFKYKKSLPLVIGLSGNIQEITVSISSFKRSKNSFLEALMPNACPVLRTERGLDNSADAVDACSKSFSVTRHLLPGSTACRSVGIIPLDHRMHDRSQIKTHLQMYKRYCSSYRYLCKLSVCFINVLRNFFYCSLLVFPMYFNFILSAQFCRKCDIVWWNAVENICSFTGT